MSHTVEETRNQQPMWFFERNYSYFLQVFPDVMEMNTGEQCSLMDKLKTVQLQCLEVSRYTTLLSLRLRFHQCPQLEPLYMQIRLYHDAAVADVIAHQNISRLVAPLFSENAQSSENHKRQANLLLYELLSGCIKKQQLQMV